MRTNFNMEYQNITMFRGDTLCFNAEVFDTDGDPVILDSASFTCKKSVTSDNTFKKSLNNGITQTDSIITVRVAPEDTKDVEAGNYYYDFEIGVGDDVFTIMSGMLTIEQDYS